MELAIFIGLSMGMFLIVRVMRDLFTGEKTPKTPRFIRHADLCVYCKTKGATK
jgi:hypothetical protein